MMWEKGTRGSLAGNIVLAALLLAGAVGVSAEGKAPPKETVLIGVKEGGGMTIKLEIEPAQAMFMPMRGAPNFARGPKNNALWGEPTQAEFRFTMRDGRVVP